MLLICCLLRTNLRSLPLAEYQAISPQFGPDVAAVFDFEQSVEQRAVYGGTARLAVRQQIAELKRTSEVADPRAEQSS